MLYSGGFFSRGDRSVMDEVPSASPESLQGLAGAFEDARLPEMLFRYRARNFPDSLDAEERERWGEYRFQRLTEPDGGGSITLDEYQDSIQSLLADESLGPRDRDVLAALLEYGDQLLAR